jgi:hypothetical protein
MKQHVLGLFEYYVSFLAFRAMPPKPKKPTQGRFAAPDLCSEDRYQTNSHHGPIIEHLFPIGGLALTCHPNITDAGDSSRRRPLGSVRIIASVG